MDPPEKKPQPPKAPVTVDVEGRSVEPGRPPSDPSSWRTEMSRRFDTDDNTLTDEAVEREREVFDRKLEHLGKSNAELSDDERVSLVFPPASSFPEAGVSTHSPVRGEQRRLSLDPLPPEFTSPSFENEPPEEDFSSIPREVIISRVLAGLVDLLVPVILGLIFVFSASWVVGLNFFSAEATRWWVIFSFAFFVQNSIFFLWTSGQTPGMYLTELRVIDGENSEPGMLRTLARVVLFLVAALSVVGLLIALFDPQCRALHDRLTGTKVVPEAGLPD